jgi:hypothetical protein
MKLDYFTLSLLFYAATLLVDVKYFFIPAITFGLLDRWEFYAVLVFTLIPSVLALLYFKGLVFAEEHKTLYRAIVYAAIALNIVFSLFLSVTMTF